MIAPIVHKSLIVLGVLGGLLVCVAIVNVVIIKLNGTAVPAPHIPRGLETYGTGKRLVYVVLGDSTTIAQGADYNTGYVRGTARFLAAHGYAVQLHNFGISGATAHDVAQKQLPEAIKAHPDVVLIAVTANDATHITRIGSIKDELTRTIDGLRAENTDVHIILTGSPQMGTIPRFPEPSRSIARFRTNQINAMVVELATQKHVIFAPIAAKTGPIFNAHHELYAADNFHPNADGYALWTPVIADALLQALHT